MFKTRAFRWWNPSFALFWCFTNYTTHSNTYPGYSRSLIFFQPVRVSITSSTVTLFLPFLPWVSCSLCLFLYRFLPPLPLLLSLLCLPLSFLCELDSWDAVSADRWSNGETGRLECQAASMLKDGGKKNTLQSTFPLEVFVRSSDFLERHSILKWDPVPMRGRMCLKTALKRLL